MKRISLFLCFLMSDIAFSIPDVPDEEPWWTSMLGYVLEQFPDVNAGFAATMIFCMGLLRAVSEFLNFIARKTETKVDDEIAMKLTKVIKWFSSLIGWFGLGKPK
jgi:hypothetical protein